MRTILFINGSIFHPERGGIERVTDLLARELKSRGYKIVYLYQSDYGEDSLLFDYPAVVFKLPSKVYYDTENIEFCEQLILDQKVDIIINQAAHNPSISKLLFAVNTGSAKVISTIHFNPKMSYDNLFSVAMNQPNVTMSDKVKKAIKFITFPFYKLSRWRSMTNGYRLLAASSHRISLLSSKYIPELKEVMSTVKDEQICYISNPNTYSSQSVDYHKKQKQIVCVGRFDKVQKRQDRLLKIWEMLMDEFPDWRLVFVGDGPLREELERGAKALSRVQFEGWQNPQAYYKNSSVLCMTSTFEGFGLVLIEAMIHSTPVVAFNSFASITDIIDDGRNGYLVKPFDLEEYSIKLRQMMSDNNKRQQMSEYARDGVSKFDIADITDHWEKLFNEIKN